MKKNNTNYLLGSMVAFVGIIFAYVMNSDAPQALSRTELLFLIILAVLGAAFISYWLHPNTGPYWRMRDKMFNAAPGKTWFQKCLSVLAICEVLAAIISIPIFFFVLP
jgi:flagellar motor component MotA